jgi:hypothetical protein
MADLQYLRHFELFLNVLLPKFEPKYELQIHERMLLTINILAFAVEFILAKRDENQFSAILDCSQIQQVQNRYKLATNFWIFFFQNIERQYYLNHFTS